MEKCSKKLGSGCMLNISHDGSKIMCKASLFLVYLKGKWGQEACPQKVIMGKGPLYLNY